MELERGAVGRLENKLRAFYRRDWHADVDILNRDLARGDRDTARFEFSPPSIITGDPFRLTPGNCLLVVGINPAWPNTEHKRRIDCHSAQLAWETGFEAYRAHRRSYFAEAHGRDGRTRNADQRYSPHFSRLGNAIAHAVGAMEPGWDAGPVARKLFRESAAIFDLLPYWSADIRHVDLSRVDLDRHDCISHWNGVIEAFIDEKAPALIIVNNCGQRSLIEAMLDCALRPVEGTDFYAARRSDLVRGTPVIAHPFLTNWRKSKAQYLAEFQASLKHLGVPSPISTG